MTTVRRTLRYWQGFTSGVGGATNVQSVGSDQIQALSTDFSHYAELYQEYRVLGVKVHIVPRFTVTSQANTTFPPIQACAFSGISAVSAVGYSVQELADAQSFRYIPGTFVKPFVCVASAKMNPTAELWFAVSGPVSALATIGCVWSYAGTLPAAYNGAPIWDTLFEWDVEFRAAL
jgi:protein involved in polysaccharide export with SLBB domain